MAKTDVSHEEARLLRHLSVFGSKFLHNRKTGELAETGKDTALQYADGMGYVISEKDEGQVAGSDVSMDMGEADGSEEDRGLRGPSWVNDIMKLSLHSNPTKGGEQKYTVRQSTTGAERPWSSLSEERHAYGWTCMTEDPCSATIALKTWNHTVPRALEHVFFEIPHFQMLIKGSCHDDQWRKNPTPVLRRAVSCQSQHLAHLWAKGHTRPSSGKRSPARARVTCQSREDAANPGENHIRCSNAQPS
jgi:hypothetical protein